MSFWLKEIPVTFGPHIADWWMVGVTAASVLASLAVAVATLTISKKANEISAKSIKIAAESSERDASHREADALRRDQLERGKVVYAVLRSLSALELSSEKQLDNHPQADALRHQRDTSHLEAVAVISTFLAAQDDENLLTWYTLQYKLLTIAFTRTKEDRARELRNAKKLISDWSRELATGNVMRRIVLQIGTNHGIELETVFVSPW